MPLLVLEDVAPDPVPVDAVVVVAVLGEAGAVVPLVTVPGLTVVPAPEPVELDVPVTLPAVDTVELGSDDVADGVDVDPAEPSVAEAESPLVLVPPVPVEADLPV